MHDYVTSKSALPTQEIELDLAQYLSIDALAVLGHCGD
jgi:hypothetical protein